MNVSASSAVIVSGFLIVSTMLAALVAALALEITLASAAFLTLNL